MRRYTTQKRVLDRLHYSHWSELRPSDVPTLIALLPQMTPDVSKKVLDVVLSVPDLAKELSKIYSDIVVNSMNSNDNSVQQQNDADRAIIDTLRKLLERDNLTTEQEEKYLSELRYYSQAMHFTTSENQSFIERAWEKAKTHQNEILGGVGFIIVGLFGYFLGKGSKDD